VAEAKRKNKKKFHFKKLWPLIVTIALLMVVLTGYYYLAPAVTAKTVKIVPGVSVQGVDLSGLERPEAIEQLTALASKVQKNTVKLKFGSSEQQVTLGELGITLDRDKTADLALAMGSQLGAFKRWYAGMWHVDRPLDPVLSLDQAVLQQYWQKEFGAAEKPARDASLEVNAAGQLEVTPSVDGYTVDFPLLAKDLVNPAVFAADASIEAPLRTVKPKVTTEQARGWGITGLVAEYTTNFNAAQTDRDHNIATAAAKLDGQVLGPGEEFSFNQVVGPREADQGYRMANVIVGNKLESGLGGGVCQVSTTLYNAALLADLSVAQRSNHSIPVSYVPVGRDATVAYDYMDLKFKNVLDNYILIKTFVGSGSLTVKIYGVPDQRKQVQIKSWVTGTIAPETTYKVDTAVEPGVQKVVQKGISGYTATAERLVLVDGVETRKDQLPGSKYQPVEQIIAVHSKADIPGAEVPAAPAAATAQPKAAVSAATATDQPAAVQPAGTNGAAAGAGAQPGNI